MAHSFFFFCFRSFFSCAAASAKPWALSLWEADREIGAHEFELAEDSDHALQINATYCGWYDTYTALGMGEACLGECYQGNVVLPVLCEAVGVKHVKAGTLAEGRPICDYRFERAEG